MRQRRPSHATVVAYLALFVALGGGAYAISVAKKNSVVSKSIKNGQVKTKDLAKNAVNGAKVADNSLSGADVNESSLGAVPLAAHANSAAPSGSAGGDLNGNYPSPAIAAGAVTANKLNVPARFTDVAGLEDAFGGCGSLNGWVNWSPDVNNRVGYYRGADGFVHLEGVTRPCGTFPTIAFNLPPGYRPARRTYLAASVAAVSPPAQSIVIFESDQGGGIHAGDVELANQGSFQTSLDGLAFRCGPSGQNGCP